MALALGEVITYGTEQGTVCALSSSTDENGRFSISYGENVFKGRVLRCPAKDEVDYPLVATSDPRFRVAVVRQRADPSLFVLCVDDGVAPEGNGRDVSGAGQWGDWSEASEYAVEDSVVFTLGAWYEAVVKRGGVVQEGVYVDIHLDGSTSDGAARSYFPPYPHDSKWDDQPPGMWRTDGEGKVQRVLPDDTALAPSTEPVIIPHKLGALACREDDVWAGGPTPERTCSGLYVSYLQEHIELVRNTPVELDVAAVSITVTGPANAEAGLYWEEGMGRGGLSLGADGEATAEGLPPGRYTVYCCEASLLDRGIAMREVDADTPGGNYVVGFGDLTVVPEHYVSGVVYKSPGVPLPGATIVGMFQTGPGIFEYRDLATTGAAGEYGPIDVFTDPPDGLFINEPEGSAYSGPPVPVPGRGFWWDPSVGARVSIIFSMYEVLANEEGLLPWAYGEAQVGHPNIASMYAPAYIKCDQTDEVYDVFRADYGYTSAIMPMWRFEEGYQVPDTYYTYSVYDKDDTLLTVLTNQGGSLMEDPGRAWAGGLGSYSAMGNIYKCVAGGKIGGNAVEANSGSLITASNYAEAARQGLETGDWEESFDIRARSASVGEEARLTFQSWDCPYCGAACWDRPNVGSYIRGYCPVCMLNGAGTDLRTDFRLPAIEAVEDHLLTVVHNSAAGSHRKKQVMGWPRPEEYEESDWYLYDWLGLDRWVAVHISLGRVSGGVFTDGESVPDVEVRLGRTVGSVMLKLILTEGYYGSGTSVQVTALDVNGDPQLLQAQIPGGAAAGTLYFLDWHPHDAYPVGYYTDVTAASCSDSALSCEIVNDGPAWNNSTGVAVKHRKVSPWACDIFFGGLDEWLCYDRFGAFYRAVCDGASVYVQRRGGILLPWEPLVGTVEASGTTSDPWCEWVGSRFGLCYRDSLGYHLRVSYDGARTFVDPTE